MLARMKRVYDWMEHSSHSLYADYVICVLFYFEAVTFFPADPLLMAYCIKRPDRALRYAGLATLGSVLGGLTSYTIGSYLWDHVGESVIHNYYVNCVLSPERFNDLSLKYQNNAIGTILIAGFIPGPYKAATLAAGFCKLSLGPFVFAAMMARGSRFYLCAFACMLFGEKIKNYFNKYFKWILLLVATLIIIMVRLFT